MDNLQYKIQYGELESLEEIKCFKPYYKWITFNTNIGRSGELSKF